MSFNYELKNKTMIVHDPIYGDIEIGEPFKDIILTKEMQRLEKISQNGFSKYDYPGLVNNERLSHSVGAFHVMSKMIEHLEKELKRYDISISKDDKDMALCSMLLHDIGHGPFSHTFENLTGYSHEKRTTDILLGDTEVNKLLTSTYGSKKLKRIASYIAEINEDEEKIENKNNFTKLLKSLISHQLDSDRLDYLVRDSYHAGIVSAINYKNVIKTLGISINNNQEYELLFEKEGLSSIETILIERFQRYRDVYYSRTDGILTQSFINITEKYGKNPDLVKAKLPEEFKTFALNPKNIPLQEFLKMNDNQFIDAFNIIKENSSDKVLAYLCDMPRLLKDYQDLDTNTIEPEMIKQKLNKIFPEKDFSNTLSILSVNRKIKLYKKEESLRINCGNVHKDLSEATPNLIRPDEYLEKKELMFNPEMLRLELGMDEKEFKKYKEDVENMINELNRTPEEFELKYIVDGEREIKQDEILNTLLEKEFKIIKISNKENNDEYYDTKDFALLKNGGSLRIRKITENGKEDYEGTYKMPISVGEVYSWRDELKVDLGKNSAKELKQKMKEKYPEIKLQDVFESPLLNSVTQRRDIVLDKNGVKVCLSFDNTRYTNHILNGKVQEDSMIEMEALGNSEHRVMLNEVNEILKEKFPWLQPNKQSKYERGMTKTMKNREKEIQEEKEI